MTFTAVEGLTLDSGAGGGALSVNQNAAGTSVALRAGAGPMVADVGLAVDGPVAVTGGPAADVLRVSDLVSGGNSVSYAVTATAVSDADSTIATYDSAIEAVELTTGGLGEVVTWEPTARLTRLATGGGADMVVFPSAAPLLAQVDLGEGAAHSASPGRRRR